MVLLSAARPGGGAGGGAGAGAGAGVGAGAGSGTGAGGQAGAAALDSARLHRLALVARMARCRGRFPISVILYRGRHICRSVACFISYDSTCHLVLCL